MSIKDLKQKKEYKVNTEERTLIKFKDLLGHQAEITAAEWFVGKEGDELCVLAIKPDKFTFAPSVVSEFFKKVYADADMVNELETVGVIIEPVQKTSKNNRPYYDFEIV